MSEKYFNSLAGLAESLGGNKKNKQKDSKNSQTVLKKPTLKAESSLAGQYMSADSTDDAALFFNAVGKVSAIPGKENHGHAPMASLLAKSKALPKESPARKPLTPPQTAAPTSLSTAASPSVLKKNQNTPDTSLKNVEQSVEQSPQEEELFSKAMSGVVPVNTKGRDVSPPAAPPSGITAQDSSAALRALLDGKLEFELRHSAEYMEGFVNGLDPLLLDKLRAGGFSPEAHLDLHGQNASQALEALIWFFKNAYQRSLRTVLVVTGRGRNSPDGVGVLRPLLAQWLSKEPFKRVVLAFCTAKPSDGGPGAVYVMLRKYKKSRGKIIWECHPADEDIL